MRPKTIAGLSRQDIQNALINKQTGRAITHDGDQIRFHNGVKEQVKENTRAN